MKKQTGASFATILVVITVLGIFVKAGIAVGPMYWEDKVLKTIIENVRESGEVNSQTRQKELKQIIQGRMLDNRLNIPTEGMVVKRVSGGLLLQWEYESRGTFIANIDLVGRFYHEEEFN